MFTKQNASLMLGIMCLASFLWWRLGVGIEDIEPRFACVVWCVGTWMFIPIFGGTQIFSVEAPMVIKELKAGNYALSSYYIARTVMMFPLDIIWPTFWLLGTFWLTNLSPSFGVFLQVLVRLYLTLATFQSVGYVIAALGMPPDAANTLANLTITFFFGWTQLLMDMRLVPSWLHWVVDANLFKYAIEMVFSIVVADMEFACSSAAGREQASLGCDDGLVSGSEARARLIISSSPTASIYLLVASAVVLRIIAFFALRYNYRKAIDGAKSVAFASPSASDEPQNDAKAKVANQVIAAGTDQVVKVAVIDEEAFETASI
jgi:hypothetical protein